MKISIEKRPRFTKHISVFLSESQYELLTDFAAANETTLSEVLRAIIDAACTSIINEEYQ